MVSVDRYSSRSLWRKHHNRSDLNFTNIILFKFFLRNLMHTFFSFFLCLSLSYTHTYTRTHAHRHVQTLLCSLIFTYVGKFINKIIISQYKITILFDYYYDLCYNACEKSKFLEQLCHLQYRKLLFSQRATYINFKIIFSVITFH